MNTGGPRPKSAAKQKLTDILAWEVSAVDRPANQRSFLLTKSEGGAPAPGTAAAPAAGATGDASAAPAGGAPVAKQMPALNPELRQKAIDAATAVSEKVAAFAALLAEAPVDEKAGPTPELAKLVQESVSELVALAQELAPSAAPVTQDAAPGGAPAGAPAAQATPSAPADVLKAFATFSEDLKKELAAKLEAKFAPLEKSAAQVGALTVKVNDLSGRLAISKAGGGNGNAHTETPEPKPEAIQKAAWPDDLGAVARAESTPTKGA